MDDRRFATRSVSDDSDIENETGDDQSEPALQQEMADLQAQLRVLQETVVQQAQSLSLMPPQQSDV